MKKNLTKAIVVFLLTFYVGNSFAQTPWKCDGRAIGTYNPGSNTFTDDTKLYSAVFDALGNVTYLDKPATTGIGLNALGFRKQDGFVYGIRYTNYDGNLNHLCRIDSTGIIDDLGSVSGLITNVQYFAGSFDLNGDLYATSGSGSSPYQLYKINVATKVATDLGTMPYRIIDMAFDPITNDLYATSSNLTNNGGELLKIDLSTNPATVTSVGSFSVFMFGLFFADGNQLYGFGRSAEDNTTSYYKLNKTNGSVTSAGDGPMATNADACSCPYRLSHSLLGKATCINVGEDAVFKVAITNITSAPQNTKFDLTLDKRFKFTESASQIQTNIQAAFPGSSAVVTISNANGGTNNVISISTITVPVTTSVPSTVSLAIKAGVLGFTPGEQIIFQSTISVPGDPLNLGTDVSDDPLTAQLDDATTLTICLPDEGPLPVSITDFKGQLNQGTANLSWKTNNELNTRKFEIERSFDGTSFAQLNVVAAKGSNASSAYQFSDAGIPANAVVYYRLKIIDNDGSFKYTSIVVLKTDDIAKEAAIYPSPFNDRIAVTTNVETKGKVIVAITDAAGRKMTERSTTVEPGSNTVTLDGLGKLQEGFYFIQIYNNGKLISTKKTMKLQ
ncbi:DUF6923 family protein [Ferruginibacter sp. SUN002]|uniref:DUF6923 family protein n=1 Tax=Ferruginibacter sp. SUN002 TaxID=2937789 RepID=UPI003D35E8AD